MASKVSNREPGRRPRVAPSKLQQEVECLLCRTVVPADLMFEERPFRIVRCPQCSLVYTLPRLPNDEIRDMYQVDYWRSAEPKYFGYADYLADRDRWLRTYRMRSEIVDQYCPRPGRVLDIGCAAGFFLKVMQEKGWETVGVELSETMVQYAREEMKLPDVRAGMLTEQSFQPASFDVISMWDVIEHLENPRPVLAQIHELLNDRGILIIETQNVASMFAKLMGIRWQHYKFEEHLWHFSPSTIKRLLSTEGFQTSKISARRGGKYVSLAFIIERAGRVHPWLSKILSPLHTADQTSIYVNPMDEIIVIARKNKVSKNG